MYMFMNAVVVQCTCFITEFVCNVYFWDNCTMHLFRNGVVVHLLQCTCLGTE